MPTRILSRTLAALGRIYRFPGEKYAPGFVDLEVPLNLVHDVSREAGRERTQTVLNSLAFSTVAGTTGFDTRDIDAFLAGTVQPLLLADQNLELRDVDLWLMRAALQLDDENLSAAAVELQAPDSTGSINGYLLALFLGPAASGLVIETANGVEWAALNADGSDMTYPVLIPPGSTIRLGTSADAGGAAEGNLNMRFAVTPKGSTPPAGLM